MDIKEAVKQKRKLNLAIRDYVATQLAEFEKETGLNVYDVTIQFLEVTEFGKDKRSIIESVSIKVDI